MKKLLLFLPIALVAACAPARYVKPLQKGQMAIGADLGGPLINYSDLVIPLPLTNLSIGYGLQDNTTVFAGIHTTALAFGLAQLDAGTVHAFSQADGMRPGISGAALLNIMVGKGGEARLYPQADVNAFWEYGQRQNLFYVGLSNWFETHSTRGHGEPQPAHWLPSLQFGHTIVRQKWDYTLELKQVAFNQDRGNTVVAYKGLGNKGATGFYFGVRRKF